MLWSTKPMQPKLASAFSEEFHAYRRSIPIRRKELLKKREAQPTIAQFYAGKNVFMTGGSGFLGRLLVESLLRTCPDIGNIYLLLRTKKGVAPEDRLRILTDVPLFDRLRAERPGALSKLVVLPGDSTQPMLGLSAEHQDLLRREVAVVFHVAASVRFDDPFQKAVFTNVRSTRDVVELARGMPKLAVLVHVSTAYCNYNQEVVDEVVYEPEHDWREVIRWAEKIEDQNAVDWLGCKLRGYHPNSYVYTKQLAEKVVEDVCDQLPVVITRPSIVVPTMKDPIPGWIDNLYGLGAFWAAAFKGVVTVFYAEDISFDSVPGDVAAKSIILASWNRGLGRSFKSLKPAGQKSADVVNVTVGNELGVAYRDMGWILSEEGVGRIVPYPGAIRPPWLVVTQNKVYFTIMNWYHSYLYALVLDLLARAAGTKPRLLQIQRSITTASAAARAFRKTFEFRYENQRSLLVAVHPKDEANYAFDYFLMSARDSVEDLREVGTRFVRGILRYTLKERDDPEKNWRHIKRLKVVMPIYHLFMAVLFSSLVYVLYMTVSVVRGHKV